MNTIETKFIAHGGYPAMHDENTLNSYLEAVKFQPFAVEMDIVVHPETSELICYHPQGISSKSGTFSPEDISEQLNNGASFVSFKKVLNQLRGQRVLVDVKQPNKTTFELLLQDENIDHQFIIVGVRNMADVSLIQELAPDVDLLALFPNPDDFRLFAEAGGKYFRLWEKDVIAERVSAIQDAGLEVWVTPGHKATETKPRTAGDINEQNLDRLVGLVNAILVNDIGFATKYSKINN